MPEGHVIHRLARELNRDFIEAPLHVSSPQGRFRTEAELLDAHPGAGAVVDGLRQGAQGHFEVGGEAVEGDELADGHPARVGNPKVVCRSGQYLPCGDAIPARNIAVYQRKNARPWRV